MEERRFDDLTRTLGAATSRRQVLKGLLAGVLGIAAASHAERRHAAAAGCSGDFKQCLKEATDSYHQCRTVDGGSVLDCLDLANTNFDLCNTCPAGQACCFIEDAVQCVDITSDPAHCGSCQPCRDPNAVCTDGTCTCSDGYTDCGEFFGGHKAEHCCPPNTTCGAVFGKCDKPCDPPCNSCQSCVDGTCYVDMKIDGTELGCSGGKICCGGQCMDKAECCFGVMSGKPCDGNKVCCHFQCVSDQCPDPKVFHYNSCSCACPPKNCPSGQQQDPDTCQCMTTCAGQPEGTACGTNKVCCGGQCIDDCGSGKTMNTNTCTCECTPVTCEPGWSQDPNTCNCELTDFCAAECDPYGMVCCTGGSFNYCCLAGEFCCNGDMCCET